MISSGVAIQGVSPSDSGPPSAKPTNPAAWRRATGSCGAPAHRCQSPSAGRLIMAAPRISRGRASGFGSVRIRTTAMATSRIGTRTTAEPMTTRTTVSIQPPTGRAASNHELAASTTAMPSRAERDAVPPVTGLQFACAADRARGRSRPLGEHQPAGPCAPADGSSGAGRGRRRASRGLAAGCGGAGRARAALRAGLRPARTGARAGGGLTCHAAKPSRNSPIFTISHTGHSCVSVPACGAPCLHQQTPYRRGNAQVTRCFAAARPSGKALWVLLSRTSTR